MSDSESFIRTRSDKNDLKFRADVTHNQFLALAAKLVNAELEKELVHNHYFIKVGGAKSLNLNEVEKWLKNSWNTEKVLSENRVIIENTGQSFAMQWAFAQAYYSTFGSLLAHFKSVGHTEFSHPAVLKKLGKLMEEGKVPISMSFYTTGGRNNIQYVNIEKPHGISNLDIDLEKEVTIENQICQFLKATREIKLIEKAPKLDIKTKKGKPMKSLGHLQWQQVSNSIGHTTVMDLLYRKRIKANYEDIDTFNYINFKGIEVLDYLCYIVERLNLVNECFVAKAIGIEQYNTILRRHLRTVGNTIVEERLQTVLAVVGAVT